MSITTVRTWLEKSGCALFTVIALVIAFALGLMTFNRGDRTGPDGETELPIARVGDQSITLMQVDRLVAMARDQQVKSMLETAAMMGQEGSFERFTSDQEALFLAQGLVQAVQSAVIGDWARSLGATLDDAQVLQTLQGTLNELVQQQRAMLVASGELKADATPEEFAAKFQETNGVTPEQAVDQQLDLVRGQLENPDTAPTIRAQAAQLFVMESLRQTQAVTDEELKASFDTFTLKQIQIRADDDTPNPAQKAEEIRASIEGGKPFEQAMRESSDAFVAEGENIADQTLDYTRSNIDSAPALAPIKDLKPGEMSAVIAQPGGATIYKLIKMENKAPADLETNKTRYSAELATVKANGAFDTQLKERLEKVEWESAGHKVLFDFITAQTDPIMAVPSTPEARERYEGLLTEAQTAQTEDLVGQRAATVAEFLIVQALWGGATPEQQDAMFDTRTMALQKMNEQIPSPDLLIELSRHLAAKNDPEAAGALIQAAGANVTFGPQGTLLNATVGMVRDELAAKNLLDEGDQAALKEELDRWSADKKTYDQEQAEMVRQRDQEMAELEAEMKAEEEKAKADEAAKNPPQERVQEAPAGKADGE